MSNAFTVSRQRPIEQDRTEPKQLPFLIRLAWFLVIGWWAGLIWIVVAITVTLGGWIFAPDLVARCWGALGPIMNLQRHDPYVRKRR